MFCEEIIELFQKIPAALPKTIDYMKKRKILLTDMGSKWFMEKHKSKPSPMKRPRLRKEANKKEYIIKKY